VGPIAYGYSVTIGPDGKPHIREFGNIKTLNGNVKGSGTEFEENGSKPQITLERDTIADVNSTDTQVEFVMELLGVKKEDIKVNAYDGKLEVITNDPERKYHRTIQLPLETDITTAKFIYNNGILEVTFDKKEIPQFKGTKYKNRIIYT
jgi:HSP20 family protein